MLVYTTKIPMNSEFSFKTFIDYVFKWLKDSEYYHFKDEQWDGGSFQEYQPSENEKLQIAIYEELNICAARFRYRDQQDLIWKTDFILNKQENKLSFQLYKEQKEYMDEKRMKLPYFLKLIKDFFQRDGILDIKDKPVIINSENISIISDIILRKVEYEFPIIYITRDKFGTFKIDPNKLAREFKGQAHVLAEENSNIQKLLQKMTDGKNPYLGALEIYYKKATERIYPSQLFKVRSEEERIELIYSVLTNQLTRVAIEDNYSWNELVNKRQKENILELKKELHEKKDYKELAEEYEKAWSASQEENQQLKDNNRVQEEKINSLNERLSSVNQEPLLILGDEEDFYEDEQKAVISEILTDALNKMPEDHKRKKDIIESVLNSNQPKCDLNKKRNELKNFISKTEKWNQVDKNELKKYGLSIKSEHKHIKLVFYDDERYAYAASKTPSDKRGRNNLAKELIHVLYGVGVKKE
ncbi:hypothetical protein [uncultured Dubosiella sp.]|uniref:hypothetical protein n=2 Tax=uncultured Dubosiella sp. TaxID=1937011 RepID=UPI00267071EF|nr:hypothetical protein [uncultured Dubosiella sp.]